MTAVRSSRHLWKIFLAAAVLVVAAYEVWAPAGYEGATSAALSALAAGGVLLGVRTHHPVRRLPWYLIASVPMLWIVGFSIQQVYVSTGSEIPVGYAADAFYLAANLALIVALVLLLSAREGRVNSWLDAGIVVLALSQLVWVALISSYAFDQTLPWKAWATQIAYAFTDVVLLALLARILVGSGRRSPAFLLSLGGVVSLLVADFGFNWLTLAGVNTAALDFVSVYLLAAFLAATAALHPSMCNLFSTATGRAPKRQWSYLGLLFVAVSITPAILATEASESAALDKHLVFFCAVAGGVMTQFVLVRMIGFLKAVSSSRALAVQNERLRELDALKDEFIASVSHELRTPLTSIRGYLELLLTEEARNLRSEQREFLAVVDRNADRLLHLVGDLLFVAQVDAGRLELTLTETDLGTLVEQTVESARPASEDKGVILKAEVDDISVVYGDRTRLAQLLDNLVSNALKFTPAGGSVRVRLKTTDAKAILEVADTGVGMSSADQEGLFDRFYRTASAQQDAVPGTGLGLSIAKAIVEAHDGMISVISAEGEGTVFRVELPLARDTQIRRPSKVAA